MASGTTVPPPYQEPSLTSKNFMRMLCSTLETPLFKIKPMIRPDETPQWVWTQTECRQWIWAVCYTYLEYSPEKATEVAIMFQGMGNYLYTMSSEVWQYFMPEKSHVISIYNILISEKAKKGAVPQGLSFPHWKKS